MDRNSEKHDPRIQVILEELRDILDFNAGEAKEDVLDVSTTILQTHFEEASRRHQEDDIGDLLVSCHKLANLSLEDDILDEVTLQSCILDEEWFTHNTENEVTFAPEIQLLENLVNQTYLSAPEEAFCEYLEQELPEIGVLPVEEPIMPGESIFYLTKDPWPKFPSLPAMAQRLPHYDTLPRVVNIVDIAPTLTSLISGPDNTFTVSKSTLEEAGQLMDWLQIDINRLEPKLWMHECWSEKADGLEPMEEPLFPLSHHFVASELAFESDKPSPMVADLLEVIESVEPKTSEQEKRDDEKLFNDLEQCVPTVDVILDGTLRYPFALLPILTNRIVWNSSRCALIYGSR
ncbi:hypothetical protein DFS34DRAFT_459172 [Phlyctochytrium arcticum]|nr:hypothetical protein DFS34DRAFT_459172 [Phlyctochytrium arcticum]